MSLGGRYCIILQAENAGAYSAEKDVVDIMCTNACKKVHHHVAQRWNRLQWVGVLTMSMKGFT